MSFLIWFVPTRTLTFFGSFPCKQWPAVTTNHWWITAPPHLWLNLDPLLVWISAIKGAMFSLATFPPIILPTRDAFEKNTRNANATSASMLNEHWKEFLHLLLLLYPRNLSDIHWPVACKFSIKCANISPAQSYKQEFFCQLNISSSSSQTQKVRNFVLKLRTLKKRFLHEHQQVKNRMNQNSKSMSVNLCSVLLIRDCIVNSAGKSH